VKIDRRRFVKAAGAGLALSVLGAPGIARGATRANIKAVAFDAFTVLDPRSVNALAEKLFPGKGGALMTTWRARQFEYSWLRSLMGNYADFWQVTSDALTFAAESARLDVSAEQRKQLMEAHLQLKAYPDSIDALRSMKASGLRLAFLSNFTRAMLDAAVQSAGLEALFDEALSTGRVRAYKPDPRAYQMAIEALHLSKDEIAFSAFGGWDAAGARSFGYTTFWVNRLGVPQEELGLAPDATGSTLTDLAAFVQRWNTRPL